MAREIGRQGPMRWWIFAAVFLFALGSPAWQALAPAAAQEPAPPAAANQAGGAHAAKATLAVLPFQTSPELARLYAPDIELLNDSLTRIFVKSNKFDVLERTKIEAVINENHFATSAIGDPANAMQFGKLTGAQYLVVGNIRDLGVTINREKIPYVDEAKCTETVRLRLELRVVQAQTGRIVSADSSGDGKSAPPRSVSCSRPRHDTLDDAMNRVAADMVAKVIDTVYPLLVVHTAGDELTLNRGEGAAFQEGSTLECFTSGERIVDPDTGDLLGYDETSVGKITVTKIMAKLSKARPEPGKGIPVGAICRLVSRAPAPKPAPQAPRPKVNF